MPRRGLLLAAAVILAAFAVGLVFFFIFSAPYGDGLEKTMENAGVEEPQPVYRAPLDYGGNYPAALAMGCLGFIIVLGSAYLIVRMMRMKGK